MDTNEEQQIRNDIERHCKAAYEMLPDELTPFVSYVERGFLDSKFEAQQWRLVCNVIQSYTRTNNLSPKLLQELSGAQEAIKLLDYRFLVFTLQQFSESEKKLIGECLYAMAQGTFVRDGDFFALLGFTREELLAIAEAWPDIAEARELVLYGITGSFSNLLNYPHHKEFELHKYTSASWDQVRELSDKWRSLRKQRHE